MDLLLTILTEGFIYGIMALGVYISYHILDFPDLSVDGSFPLGAAVSSALIVMGVDPYLSLAAALAAGAVSGMVTGILNVKLKITDLLSGILVMTALYTVNLRIVGKSNLFLLGENTIFNSGIAKAFPAEYASVLVVVLVFAFSLIIKLALDWYLKTKSGLLLRATGDNAQLVTTLAQDSGRIKIIGLVISNGLVSLSGGILCQRLGAFNITMGTGMIVMGVASVIIGITVFGKLRFIKGTTVVLLGAIIYRACIALVLVAGFKSEDMKLMMAIVLVAALIFNKMSVRRSRNNAPTK